MTTPSTTPAELSRCAECGMHVRANEYHPFAACLMFKACHDSDTVRASLVAVQEHGPATTPADGELLDCPFCGCSGAKIDPEEWSDDRGNKGPACPECNAMADSVSAWNRRAAPSPGKAPEPVAWRIDDPDDPEIGHWFSEEPTEGYRSIPLYASPGKAEAERWQPIETAPKDMEIWAFNGEQARMVWSEGPEWALWVWADWLLADADPSPDQPTHWMPLPAPPQEHDKQ